jgi:hypothetical protein
MLEREREKEREREQERQEERARDEHRERERAQERASERERALEQHVYLLELIRCTNIDLISPMEQELLKEQVRKLEKDESKDVHAWEGLVDSAL